MPAPDPADDATDAVPEPRLAARYVKSEALGQRITEYCAWLNAGEFRLLQMIREFDQEGLWQLGGVCSCAHWLNWKCGIGMNAAREKVRVANALGDLPQVSETYRKGEISYSKVRAISRIATPETEEYLLMIARHGTASHVEGLVSRYRRCTRLQDRDNAIKQHALRELSCFYDEDGSFTLHGRFPAEQGALIAKALELAMERTEAEAETERQTTREAWGEDRPYVSAETPEGTPAVGGTAEAEASNLRYYDDPSAETRPRESFSARRADALGQLAETYLTRGPKATCSADRYQVVVHVSAETLPKEMADGPVGVRPTGDRDPSIPLSTPAPFISPAISPEASIKTSTNISIRSRSKHPPAETPAFFTTDFAWIEDGPHLAADTVRRLSCDASKVEVTDDEEGEPLNIGRKSRSIPPALRRVLRMRDDGCRFPGCTHKHFIDGHHIEHWADGGETSLINLIQLCRHHHRLLHEGGFGCERAEDGRIRFTNPLGIEIGRSGELPPVAATADPRQWLQQELDDLAIESTTGVTRWLGERIDWPLAVGHLFDKQGL